jgi:hypothetical protein
MEPKVPIFLTRLGLFGAQSLRSPLIFGLSLIVFAYSSNTLEQIDLASLVIRKYPDVR